MSESRNRYKVSCKKLTYISNERFSPLVLNFNKNVIFFIQAVIFLYKSKIKSENNIDKTAETKYVVL